MMLTTTSQLQRRTVRAVAPQLRSHHVYKSLELPRKHTPNAPRRGNRTLVYATLYLTLLALILYLSHPYPSNPNTTFPWRTIRYRSPNPPPTYGACPSFTSPTHDPTKPILIVASTPSENTTWLSHPSLTSKYTLCIYAVSSTTSTLAPSDPRIPIPHNRAQESLPYLTFLASNYAYIATHPMQAFIFIHGSRFAWHNDYPRTYDNLAALRDLNVSAALEMGHGYANLRCDWSVGTCGKGAVPQGSWQTWVMAGVMGTSRRRERSDRELVEVLGPGGIFEGRENGLRGGDVLRAPCCAQFVVKGENVLRHGREEYEGLLGWLLDGVEGGRKAAGIVPSNEDDRIAGRVMSYLWHVLFLPSRVTMKQGVGSSDGGVNLAELNRMACPDTQTCYCRLYGRCDLKACVEGQCPGQYSVPKGYKLPDDWEGIVEQSEKRKRGLDI
jgi:hypothetical protein